MAALRSSCGHYIFAVWFRLSFFISSPNLSRRRRHVYHTSTHGGSANLECRYMKHAARTRLTEIQPFYYTGRKNRQKFAICAPSYNFVGLYLRN